MAERMGRMNPATGRCAEQAVFAMRAALLAACMAVDMMIKCGMQAVDRAVKTFRNTEMTFLLFQAERNGRADGTDESCGGPLR